MIELIKRLPKTDLHIHLDGSVRINTLIELSKENNLKLPSYTESGLNNLVFKKRYKNLNEYLTGFSLILPVMQTSENLERISYEFANDSIKDGVCYVEVRFAPHLHINKNQSIDEVLLSIDRGLNKAKKEHNKKNDAIDNEILNFDYSIIVCAMRSFTKGFSEYLDKFIDNNKNLNSSDLVSLSSYELIRECVRVRDAYNLPIVALDIAGSEVGNPPALHKKAYVFARQNLIHLTAHAGEATGPDNIHQAITELSPNRIGHGYHLFDEQMINNSNVIDKKTYVRNLVEYIAHSRITLEICLTSNLQTDQKLANIKDHPLKKMLNNNLIVTICTDNRTISKTTSTKELMIAIENFDLNPKQIKQLVLNGFKKSFYPKSYQKKLQYIKQVESKLDSLLS